jgi:oxygen-independent coproporphyrinogen-3 oxidase
MSTSLRRRVEADGLFQGYAYSYPHKTAYRRLDPPVVMEEVWAEEDREALFLYAHIPYCGMRCGFCNLFTTTGGTPESEVRYLDSIERQAGVMAGILEGARFTRAAIGGGTPTILSPGGIERLFRILSVFQRPAKAPLAVEMSPETVDEEKMLLLRSMGVTRASLGVQSFVEAETRALGRPQKPETVRTALTLMKDAGFPVINVDLIYGMEGQTSESWETSLAQTLEYEPEEVYLYPLYVRPLTGLGRKGRAASEKQAVLYRHGRDYLLARGYRQVSMRLFRAGHYQPAEGPVYCCQEDGMLGLGAGARSYTRRVHYSSEWAVGRESVRGILDDFVNRGTESFARADYGCVLTDEEQRRRYLIKSLLRADGLHAADYRAWFGADAVDEFPQIQELVAEGAAVWREGFLVPTALGLEWSDVIGPWLYSGATTGRMESFALK